MECQLHQESDFKMTISFEAIEPYYSVILPLRMLSLKTQAPKSWQELMNLTSHVEEWQKSRFWEEDHQLATEFILTHFHMDGLDQELIFKMYGIAYVNDFFGSTQ